MPDDENTAQNPISEKNSIPASPQGPTEPASKNTVRSESSTIPLEALESSPKDFPVKSNDMAHPDSIPKEAENEQKIEEKQAQIPLEPTGLQADPAPNGTSEPALEPVSEPMEAPELETPQIPVNEALEIETESQKTEPKQPKEEQIETEIPEPETEKPRTSYLKSQKWSELLVLARNAMQSRKRKKLDSVMTLFLKKSEITNDEVEKLLHVSDATATRYLDILEKEGKIKQNGKTGRGVSYSRI